MKSIRIWSALACGICLLAGTTLAADSKAVVKQTCCQEAAAKGKECRHKCCVAAHKEGKSCTVCNPNQEDLKLKKNSKKATDQAAQKAAVK